MGKYQFQDDNTGEETFNSYIDQLLSSQQNNDIQQDEQPVDEESDYIKGLREYNSQDDNTQMLTELNLRIDHMQSLLDQKSQSYDQHQSEIDWFSDDTNVENLSNLYNTQLTSQNPQNYTENVQTINRAVNAPLSNIKVKSDKVQINNLRPELKQNIADLSQLYPGLTVSSGNDQGHHKHSTHYDNEAVDIGANSSNAQAFNSLKKNKQEIAKQYGLYILDEGDHLHISKSSKGKK